MIVHFVEWLKNIIVFSLLNVSICQNKWTNMSRLVFAIEKRTLLAFYVYWWFMNLIFIDIIIEVDSHSKLSFQTHFLYFWSNCCFIKYAIKVFYIRSWHTLKLLIDLPCFFWWTIFHVLFFLNSSLNNTILGYSLLFLRNHPFKVFIITFILILSSFVFNFSIIILAIFAKLNARFWEIVAFSDLANFFVCLSRNQN